MEQGLSCPASRALALSISIETGEPLVTLAVWPNGHGCHHREHGEAQVAMFNWDTPDIPDSASALRKRHWLKRSRWRNGPKRVSDILQVASYVNSIWHGQPSLAVPVYDANRTVVLRYNIHTAEPKAQHYGHDHLEMRRKAVIEMIFHEHGGAPYSIDYALLLPREHNPRLVCRYW